MGTVSSAIARALPDTESMGWGYLCGSILALGASVSFAAARAGILQGLTPGELILMRFGVSALILTPFLVCWGLGSLGGIGWKRGIILTLLAGPLFGVMQLGGYAFAPLAHGAVIHPASVTILSTGIAAVALHERLGRAHLLGAALVLAGIVLISWHGLHVESEAGSWKGDLLFFTSAILWAGFTVLVRHWQLHAIRAIAVVSFLSCLIYVPAYLAWYGFAHVAALPMAPMLWQAVAQGLVQGVLAITAYSQAIRVLGVSRAVLFPAMVPAVSVLVGIPIVGEIPSEVQIGGLLLVTAGLFMAIGGAKWFDRAAR